MVGFHLFGVHSVLPETFEKQSLININMNMNVFIFLLSHFLARQFVAGADSGLRGSNAAISHQDNLAGEGKGMLLDDLLTVAAEERKLVAVDDRKLFQPTSKPWTALGRVETATATCTGVLVGPCMLLTAQCCAPWWNSDGSLRASGDLGWLKFTPAYYDGKHDSHLMHSNISFVHSDMCSLNSTPP